ncbi:MAG TPA: ATP-dependent Clp protease ATP-binding subunit ClpC, partial [Firmicutes bacterium]|nr:ATP-dependent Clp protease ATP-binding subunit ClpC [Bacillota bacterium]
DSYERMRDKVMSELKRTFRPEFLNRVDEVIVFHALGRAELEQIVELMLRQVSAHLEPRGIRLAFTPAAKDHLVDEGYSPEYGARPLRRVIQRLVEDRLSDEIIACRIKDGQQVGVDVQEGALVFRVQGKKGAPDGAAKNTK